MAPPGGQDHRITLAEASALTQRHRARGGPQGARAFGFPREAFEAILAQPRCTGIRIYLGLGADGASTLVLVGMDAEGADLTDGEVMNRGWPCPPVCPPDSALAE